VDNQIVLLGENDLAPWSRLQGSATAGVGTPAVPVDLARVTSLKETLETVVEHYERKIVRECLERNRGNKSRTASALAITRRTLARKIEKYRL
jgi:transcriptional regulator with PAS, ATPase and Fis domain